MSQGLKIDLWYGDEQHFGQHGLPQKYINILGRASSPAGISSVRWGLRGEMRPLSLGPTAFRLRSLSDFNIEIDAEQLEEGENELRIVYRSPVQYIAARQEMRPLPGVSQAIPGGPYMRKAPCQFGWDWGPQLPPIGVWKDIRLEGRSAARWDDVHLRQYHKEGKGAAEEPQLRHP